MSKNKSSRYQAHYDPELKKILSLHGDGDPSDEIELLRYLHLLVLKKMNEEQPKFSFHDYLDTLRAMTKSSAEIARLIAVLSKLRPITQREAALREDVNRLQERVLAIAKTVMSGQQLDDLEFDAVMQNCRNAPDDRGNEQ